MICWEGTENTALYYHISVSQNSMSPSALFPSIPAFSQGVKKFEKLLFLSTLLSFQLLINYSLSSSTVINWSKKHACCSRHYFVQSKFSIPVNSKGLVNNDLSHWSWFFLKVKKRKKKTRLVWIPVWISIFVMHHEIFCY